MYLQHKSKHSFLRRTPLTTYLPTDSEKPPRRGFPSGGVDCFLLCRPSAPSLSCLEVGHRALLWCVFFCRQRLRFGDARVDPRRRLPPHLLRDMGVGVQRGSRGDMAQDGGQRLNVHSVGEGIGGEGVPLRYNYDKPEKPRISRAFGYLARFFILFQTEKSSREVLIS